MTDISKGKVCMVSPGPSEELSLALAMANIQREPMPGVIDFPIEAHGYAYDRKMLEDYGLFFGTQKKRHTPCVMPGPNKAKRKRKALKEAKRRNRK